MQQIYFQSKELLTLLLKFRVHKSQYVLVFDCTVLAFPFARLFYFITVRCLPATLITKSTIMLLGYITEFHLIKWRLNFSAFIDFVYTALYWQCIVGIIFYCQCS